MDEAEKVRMAGLIGGDKGGLISLAQDFVKLRIGCEGKDGQRFVLSGDEELASLRLRTNKNEIIITPFNSKDAGSGELIDLIILMYCYYFYCSCYLCTSLPPPCCNSYCNFSHYSS
jgi:hypothetical protein